MKKSLKKRTDHPDSPETTSASPPSRSPFTIVGIGASAGGLEAFTQLLKALPLDTGMGFVLVQHLDPEHESALTQILSRTTKLPVREVSNNQAVEANHVYIIPPDTNLSIAQGVLKLAPRPRTRAPHRPIDAFFESLAQDQHEGAIGVVLSGTASDGTLGLEAIKAEGGITFAQDDSAKYDSMPRSAVAAGCVDLVLSPAAIAKELARIAKHVISDEWRVTSDENETRNATSPEHDRASATAYEDDETSLPSGRRGTPHTRSKQVRAKARDDEKPGSVRSEDSYKKILLLLRNHSGVDFSLYKSTTIQRRITRRLVLNKQNTLDEYASFLRGNAKELDALYSDVLISVTSFFRNPEMFDVLQREVLPKLLKQRGDDPLRVWVLGCSTGQEAYSIAISFLEAAEKAPRVRRLQVFATDLNDALLDKARHGLYAKNLADDISPQRLQRFFVEEEGGYRVSKALREMVVFARQNLVADPPFSRMDLISCRNLLIYLEPSLQKKVLPTFHYALKPEGFLLLGASESIGGFTGLFEPVDRKHKIYSKKPAPTPGFHLPLKSQRAEHAAPGARPLLPMQTAEPEPPEGLRGELSAQREADRIAINQFVPPGVLINSALQVLQFRGPTGAYLEPPPSKASFDVLKMAREGLMLPLRAAINEAKKQNKTARRDSVRVRSNGNTRTVNLEVIPLKNLRERCFLVVFGKARGPSQESLSPRKRRKEPDQSQSKALQTELSETREYLQAMQEQHEAANEELQAANEEVQSANEELQSINEELETSKEELESANEELITVNEEMANRNAELNRLNNDLINVQTSAKLVIVLLGRDLTIHRFSQQAEKQFDLLATDIGRPISHLRHNLVVVEPSLEGRGSVESPLNMESLAAEVIASVREQECEVRDKAGRWHSLRVRPYMTLDNRVDGAVLVLTDIDALKHSEQAIAAARDVAENTIDTMRDPLLVLDGTLRIVSANRAFYRDFAAAPTETIGKFIYDLADRQWDIPRLRELLTEILPRDTSVEEFQVEHEFEQLGRRTMLLNARRVVDPVDPQRNPERILLAIEDITKRWQAVEQSRRDAETFTRLVDQSPFGIYMLDSRFQIYRVSAGAQQVFSNVKPLIGRDFAEAIRIIWPEPLASKIIDIFRHTLETGEPYLAPSLTEQRHDVDAVESYEWQVHRVTLPDGQYGVVCYFFDATRLRAAEQALRESETRFRTLADSAPVLMWVNSPTGCEYVNRGYLDFLGVSLEQVQQMQWAEHLHPEDAEEYIASYLRAVQEHSVFEAQFRFRRADGEYRWMKSTGLPRFAAGDEFLGYVGCSLDITDIKHMENELRQYSAELSDADRRKTEFLAMLAHELRNPLAPILNALQIMRLESSNHEIVQSTSEMMERQLSHLVRLVDELLDVSRISCGKIELRKQPIELASVISQVVEAVRSLYDSAGQQLTVALPPKPIKVNADPGRLVQAIGNLLNNACKFTRAGGRVWLTVEREGVQAVIRVRDTGIGIATEQLPRVFDMFMQVDTSLERSVGGLGIGLTLVKTLAEMHDGTVEVHSDGLDQGSEFVVRLPLLSDELQIASGEKKQVGGHAPALHDSPLAIKKRILVVDDNRDSADSLAMLLAISGNETHTAYDGLEAVEAATKFRPEVILLDIGLPKLNGLEAARKIREQPWGKKMVLIALTGWGQEQDRQKCKDAGFDTHLVKPVDLDVLAKLLAEIPPARGFGDDLSHHHL